MKTLVFADVHLKVDAANRNLLEEFVAFLRSIDPTEFDRMIIVGDLFDFWFEYRHVVFSGYFDVLRALADLRDRGVECHLICGNHDFWAGRFFEDQLGFQVHRVSFECRFGNRRALFVHGDGVNPRDTGYRFYKRIAQSRLAIGLFGLLHPDWAMAIAQRVSHSSRRLQSPKDPANSPEIAAIREHARGLIESGQADIVVCGHTHHPAQEEIGGGCYINTGGWLDQRAYWIWDGQSLTRYTGLLTERRPAPVLRAEERQRPTLHPVDVTGEEPGQS